MKNKVILAIVIIAAAAAAFFIVRYLKANKAVKEVKAESSLPVINPETK